MFNKYFIILFLFIPFLSFSEDVKSILENIKKVYTAPNISYDLTYSLYKGHSTNTIHSSYNGVLKMKNKLVYQKIKSTEFIYAKDYFLKVSNDERIIVLDLPNNSFNADFDVSKIVEQCSSVSHQDKGNYYSVTLKFNDLVQVPYGVIKMRVNKKKYTITRIDLYYSNLQDFSNSYKKKDLDYPHLRIDFTNISFKLKVEDRLFSFETYLKRERNILYPTGKYVGYKLLDNRIK